MEPNRETRGGPSDQAPGAAASCRHRILAALALATALLWGAVAQAQSTPRAAEHDNFGRMVFDWPGPVQWSADVVNNQLVLRFDKPVAGDPRALLKPLAHYLKSVTVSPDRRMLSFPLAVPVEVKTFVSDGSTVVDIKEAAATASVARTQPARPAPPAAATAPEGPAIDLMVRGGDHPGFTRVVFDWPKPVTYAVTAEEGTTAPGKATIAFDRPARVNATALAASLPPDVAVADIHPQGKGIAVVLTLPPKMRVRHFTSGPKIVLDLVRPADADAPPPRTAGAPPPPLAPAHGTDVQPTTLKPLEAEPPPPPPQPPVAQPQAAAVPGIGIAFDQPAAAAAFPRAGWLWLVFDRAAEIDPKALVRTGGGAVLDVQPVPVKGGTALRLMVKPGFQPVPRREGRMWVFDLLSQPLTPRVGLDIAKQFDFEDKGRLVLKGGQPARTPILVRDPEVGDLISVVPTTVPGAGVWTGLSLPALDLLPTAQGVAMVPHADGVHLETGDNVVEATMPGGIAMSHDRPSSFAGRPAAAPAAAPPGAGPGTAKDSAPPPPVLARTAPLDLVRWMEGGLDQFEPVHQRLLGQLAATPQPERGPVRIALARHYLANAMAAEALGVLRVAAAADPALENTAEFRAVRGAANFLMQRYSAAIADLSHPTLANDPQAALWLAAARAASGDAPQQQAAVLRPLADAMKGWPARLRIDLARVAVPTLTSAGENKAAAQVVDALNGPGFNSRDQGTIDYLAGLVAEAGKNFDLAVRKYRAAEDGGSRPDRAFAARNRIELQLKLGQITPAEAIHQMQRLRFAWRGGDFEYRLLKRLGELLISDGQYGEGLRALRALIDNFPDNPDIPNVAKEMQDTFNRLFLGGAADKLQPVVAIGLYDEFQELTPQGEQGDEMIRKLADRLASVDLMDRASDLLRHQVQFRLNGIEKAKVGARLAFVELTDHKAQQALDALDGSEATGEPPELYDQRRYMRVRALADLGRSAEALALIINDDSMPARKLRAEIYWDMKKWPEAAAALDVLLPPVVPGRKPDDATQRRVLDLATALTLAKDERGLARLRRTWGGQMATSDFKEAFDLLTAPPEQGIPDFRRMPAKIKEAQDFQTFMSEWSKRVKATGLSSLN